MSTDHIRYDLLVQDALRGVVKNVLADAGKTGLPGEHHFYVSFRTGAPGVRISNRLREQYPEEMTIVLQHQFWDLGITEHTFEVGLSFGGVPERLLVPFDAIVGFFDPSVQFGLKFEVQDDTVAENDDTKGAATNSGKLAPVVSLAPMAAPKAAGGVLKQQDTGKATSAKSNTAKTSTGINQTGQNNQKPSGKEAPQEMARESGKLAAKKAPAGITAKPRSKKADTEEADKPAEQPTAAIVSLDAFRKKK